MSTKLIISCIGGTGALGGVVAGSYYLLNNKETTDTTKQQDQLVTKKPLKELLGANFEVLDMVGETDKDTWKKLVTKYKEGGNTGKIDIVGGMNNGGSDDNATNIKKLQTACATLLAKKDDIVENDKTIAKNWCNKLSTLIKGK